MEIKYSSHSIWLWQTQMLIMPDCNLLTINIWENVSKLLDHAAQNSSNYLNGHCFVSIMLCVPVWNQDKISYLSVPLGYRMWKKKESKLELAATMIRKVMPQFQSREQVIILCDSWYTKQNLVCIVNEYPNLDLIGNARIDSVMYDLAPAHTGRRGRPAKHGKRLSVETDFTFSGEKIGDYYTGVRRVFTRIFGNQEVLAYVTATEKEHGKKRLFSVRFFQKNCRFSVHGRKKHHWIRPAVTGWNISHCFCTHFAGILRQATMSRKHSGLFAAIWCGAAKGLKCWSIWSISAIVPWNFCRIRIKLFLNIAQRVYRNFVLN